MAKATIVVGLGYGDEGKGALASFLAEQQKAKLVVRFNGGAQAAHNVVAPDGRHHTFAQFGSGTFSGAATLMSRKTLVDPGAMLNEARHLAELGIPDPLLAMRVEAGALVTSPYQAAVNKIRETRRGRARHGSCGMGIFETVQDSVDRPDLAIRAGCLAGAGLRDRLEAVRLHKLAQAEALEGEDGEEARKAMELLRDPDSSGWVADDWAAFARRAQVVDHGWLAEQCASPGSIIFEGAQGVLLDERLGFLPYATRSTATFDGALDLCAGCSSAMRIGVMRSHMTRHGAGPFVSEDPEAAPLAAGDHNKFGPWQRSFRAGWADLLALEYACRASAADGLGPDALAVSHLDGQGYWAKICCAYEGEPDPELFEGSAGRIESILAPKDPAPARQERLARALQRARPVWASAKGERDFLELVSERAGAPAKIAGRGPRWSDWGRV